METFDMVIIGSGSAAMAAVTKASELGAKTAVIERGPVIGGTCVNVGCVPTKYLLRTGEIYYYATHNEIEALSGGDNLKLDFGKAIESKRRLVEEFRDKKYINTLKTLPGVTTFTGTAAFTGANQVSFDGQTIGGEKFLIAVGSSSFTPPIEGLEEAGYLTNIEALELDRLPESLIILGGGPLGLEFAQMFSHFGTEVSVVQRGPNLLPRMEPEISQAIRKYLSDEGIEIITGAAATKVRLEGKEKILTVKAADGDIDLWARELLVSTGRTPNSGNLGLEEIGVELGKRGAINVDANQRTSLGHIFAAGDVTGEPMLETVAAKEGTIAVENALTGSNRSIDYLSVPSCVFTYPQVAKVGLTDAEANEKRFECACRVLDFDDVPKAKVIGDTRGVIKMTAEAETGRILGVNIVAPEAGDLIHEATLAVKFNMTIYDIIDTVHVFPTLSESIKLVAQSYLKDVANLPCCTD